MTTTGTRSKLGKYRAGKQPKLLDEDQLDFYAKLARTDRQLSWQRTRDLLAHIAAQRERLERC